MPSFYEAVIKVNRSDEAGRRARDICEGIGYACALLMDEYGMSAEAIAEVLERTTDDLYDQEAQRA